MLAEKLERFTKEDYYALPEGTNSELINGLIYDMSPAPLRIHQKLVGKIYHTIEGFIEKNNGKCEVYPAPFDVELAEDSVVQPDISVICDPGKLTDKGCSGAPDWVIEVTSSNYAHDYVYKLQLYYTSNVREYWIVNPDRKTVTVYRLSENYISTPYTFEDTIPVGIYENKLEINISEMLK